MNWAALYAILSKKIDDISALQMKKVTELPETGETNTLYLVPKTTAEEGNYSDEYIWDADLEDFEKVGDTLINDSPLVIFLCEYKNYSYHLKDGFSGADIVNAITNGKYVIIITPAKKYQIFFFLQYDSNWAHFISFNQPSMSYGNITFYRVYNDSSYEYLSEFEYSFLMTPPSLADENKILKANSNKGAAWADMPNIATAYSSSSTYDLGDLCLYHNVLYECTTAITVAEAWKAAHWTQVNVSDELDKKANLTDIPADANHNIAAAYDATATYSVGDLCIYNGVLYSCNTVISQAEAWDSTHWTQTTADGELDKKANTVDIENRLPVLNSSNKYKFIYINGNGTALSYIKYEDVYNRVICYDMSYNSEYNFYTLINSVKPSEPEYHVEYNNRVVILRVTVGTGKEIFICGYHLVNPGGNRLDAYRYINKNGKLYYQEIKWDDQSNSRSTSVTETLITDLPAITSSDEGKVLTVDSNGNWVAAESEATTALQQQY